jgi:thioredoxin reductase (NADPH)
VVVVGGGNSAFQEAMHLAEIVCDVTVLLRTSGPPGRYPYVDRAAYFPNLSFRTDGDVVRVIGEVGVDGVLILDQASGKEEDLAAAALFPFIGLEPQSMLAPAEVVRDDKACWSSTATCRRLRPAFMPSAPCGPGTAANSSMP